RLHVLVVCSSSSPEVCWVSVFLLAARSISGRICLFQFGLDGGVLVASFYPLTQWFCVWPSQKVVGGGLFWLRAMVGVDDVVMSVVVTVVLGQM
ncbi:hypothetical protein A2U01_0047038, partial [Trifolium medium]|nr:hypothetical protein [Trifolium medium]